MKETEIPELDYLLLVHNAGEPFFLVIHEGETLTKVKLHIQNKLQVSDEEFSKGACVPIYVQDLTASDAILDKPYRTTALKYVPILHSGSFRRHGTRKDMEDDRDWSQLR